MDDPILPLIRGRIERSEAFRSTRGGGGEQVPPPVRNPPQHRVRLLRSLDAVLNRVKERPDGTRDPLAAREIVAVRTARDTEFKVEPLGDTRKDVRAVSHDSDEGVVLIDTPNPELPGLRRKIEQYGDLGRLTRGGRPRNEPAIAPIEAIGLAGEEDLAGVRLRESALSAGDVRWFEVACRGGWRRPEDETERTRVQIRRQLDRLGCTPPQEYLATEHVVFFVRASLAVLRRLIASVDCVYEFDLAAPEIRDWLHAEGTDKDLGEFVLQAPYREAPGVVVLDTGVATAHPYLEDALLSASSVDPFDPSPEDADGHGTGMAGVALYENLGAALDSGWHQPSHWIQAVKLFRFPQQGSADESQRPYWPRRTEDAIGAAESEGIRDRPRCFALAVTSDVDDLQPTFWTHAIDRLAFNAGSGRLILVSSGNSDINDLAVVEDYPQMHLVQKVKEPSHATNALTVGAFTSRTTIPPDPDYSSYRAVAPAGGLSPYSSTGPVGGAPIKPEIVMEGGNIGFDGALPSTMESMSGLTTHHDLSQYRLSIFYGTSEATARAANLAARIWHTTPDLRPATVRGLLVHAASWTPTMVEQFANLDERLAAFGYGIPNEGFARGCARERATVIVEDEMPNGIAEEATRGEASKQTETKGRKTKYGRIAKFFRLPIPEDPLVDLDSESVELRVTLSYYPEPNIERRRGYNGLDLRWDMQGPQEGEEEFRARINRLQRGKDYDAEKKPSSFPWAIGIERRSRGTVQSDRWRGAAAILAGERLIAVYPALGWWDRREALKTESMPFSLIATVCVPGLEIYTPIRTAVEVLVEVPT